MTYGITNENGVWHPGGGQRCFIDPFKRAGIADGQLALGRSLISPVVISEESGMGFTLPWKKKKKKKKSPEEIEKARVEAQQEGEKAAAITAEKEEKVAAIESESGQRIESQESSYKTVWIGAAVVAAGLLFYLMRKK